MSASDYPAFYEHNRVDRPSWDWHSWLVSWQMPNTSIFRCDLNSLFRLLFSVYIALKVPLKRNRTLRVGKEWNKRAVVSQMISISNSCVVKKPSKLKSLVKSSKIKWYQIPILRKLLLIQIFTYSLTLIYSPATYCVLPTAVVISFM